MKKKTNLAVYFVMLGASAILTLGGCAKEETSKKGACNWEKEYEVYMQKLDAFTNKPNSTNCSALRSAAITMINKLGNCTDVSAASIKQAANAWVDLDCSDF